MLLEPRFTSTDNNIQQEIQQDLTNAINDLVNESSSGEDGEESKFFNAIFPKGHPYGLKVSDILKTINNIQLSDIQNKHNEILDPDKITISLVGNFDFDTVKDSITQNLGKMPAKESTSTKIPSGKIKTSSIKFKPVKSSDRITIIKGWNSPSINSEDYFPFYMLSLILEDESLQSRFFKEFRENQKGLTYSIEGYNKRYPGSAFYLTYLQTSYPEKSLKTLDKVIKDVIDNGVTTEEINQCLKYAYTGEMTNKLNVQKLSLDIATHINSENHSIEEIFEKLNEVTPEQIQAVAKKYLSGPSLTMIFGPKENLDTLKEKINLVEGVL
jgi:zinc protease